MRLCAMAYNNGADRQFATRQLSLTPKQNEV